MSLSKKKSKKWSLLGGVATVTITSLLLLSACGGDSGSSSGPNDNGTSDSDLVAATFDDLPVCSDKREGVIAYVKDEKNAYTCIDGDWTLDSVVDSLEESSSSKYKTSSSSRHCEDCKDEAISSSSLKYEQNSSGFELPDEIAIKDKSISGLSQKGPFVTGSAVKLYELNAETFAQTGKSFTGKITADDGKFSVSSVTLASQYALLEANGYFRNEITGKKSSGTVTLNALTDLSDRKNVNINLLTHLEYERALYLVGTGINIPSAKKKAEAEILSAFGIKGEFANSEDLDIFSTGDGNAALLAFSVLMLRDQSEADLTEFLTKFATDIERDGSWDDLATKAKIADWAQARDLAGELATIRSNIEKWNLGTVPEFEKYLRNFWYTSYGLGECGANNNAEVLATKNELSIKYGSETRYICRDGAWEEATDIEKDTYKWGAGDDGDIRAGDVTKTKKYDYDGNLKKWRDATTVEAALGGCTEAREGDLSLNTGKVNGTWYICKNRVWESTNNITVDTQGWIKGSDGDLQKGDSTDAFYKYDEAQNKWLTATHNDTALKLMGCTTNRTGEIGKSFLEGAYYVCKDMDWRNAEEIDYDTYGETCSSAEVGKMIDGVVTVTNKYYCTSKGWINLMDWSLEVPKEMRLNPEITYGNMTDSRDKKVYKTVKIGNQVWMAENLNYYDATLNGLSWCVGAKNSENTSNCAVTGRLYTWAGAIDSVKLATDLDNPRDCGYGKTCTLPDTVYGICPPGWHLPTDAEWETLFTEMGGRSVAGGILKSQTGWYNGNNSTDAVGFSALPGGYRHNEGSYYGSRYADFWSSTEEGLGRAYNVFLEYNSTHVSSLGDDNKDDGFSVRCIQN